jgi:hypothetical protein
LALWRVTSGWWFWFFEAGKERLNLLAHGLRADRPELVTLRDSLNFNNGFGHGKKKRKAKGEK